MWYNVQFVLFVVLVPLLVDVTAAHHSRGHYANVTIVLNPAKPASHNMTEITVSDSGQLVTNPMLEMIFCSTEIMQQHAPLLYPNSFNGLMTQHLLIETNVSDIKPFAFNNTILGKLTLKKNQLEEVRAHFFFNISVNGLDLDCNNIKYIEKGAFKEIARRDQQDLFKDDFCVDKEKYPPSDWKVNPKYVRGSKTNNFLSVKANKLESVQSGIFNNLNFQFLIISRNQISVLEPNSFSECSALKTIDLRDNRLTRIERNVFNCESLKFLYLQNNSIESIEAGAFEKSPGMWKIFLGQNKLKVLKKGVFKMSLQVLRLEENGMTSIEAGAFEGLTVEELRLTYNSLSHISKGVFCNFSVIELFLTNNTITSIEPQAFSNLPVLSFLSLKNNKLTNIDKNMFHNVPNLKRIDLMGNAIISTTPPSWEGLPVFLNTSLSQ